MAHTCFAYYCSGHGYGHATRVSALACHLLKLESAKVRIHIVSSAPPHVFADSIALGALYRSADIDPVIIQPLAYHVDRQKSIDALKIFLDKKQVKLEQERQWLVNIKAHCVLSDAAFLGCLAAKAAGIPSVLITNFTFDSVYSYLSAPVGDMSSPLAHLYPTTQNGNGFGNFVSDKPVPLSVLSPLVEEIHAGYRCADLLLLLPGCIPIPSFSVSPMLPAQDWVDPHTQRFRPQVISHLTQSSPPAPSYLHTAIPFPSDLPSSEIPRHVLERAVVRAPLLVRLPAAEPSVYTTAGRTRFLSSIGIPSEYHDPYVTRILVVSFGGQIVRRPSSRPPSRPSSRLGSRSGSRASSPERRSVTNDGLPLLPLATKVDQARMKTTDYFHSMASGLNAGWLGAPTNPTPRLATSSHLWFPGAPPVSKPPKLLSSPQQNGDPGAAVTLTTPSPLLEQDDCFFSSSVELDEGPRLLPDSSWIAIVCGVSKEQWNELESDAELPSGFFIAPKYVYMPDLMAVADVLLGKLGYGTVSECIDSCSPFIYVSRPLFIEEYGLRLFLEREGVGVELSRQSYEEGDWAGAVEEAWAKGKEAKWTRRRDGAMGVGITRREDDGVETARSIIGWVEGWWSGQCDNGYKSNN